MKALKVIKKIAGLALASVGFVMLCGEGGRYEVSLFGTCCWLSWILTGSWLLGLQNFGPIREKFAEYDAMIEKEENAGEEE